MAEFTYLARDRAGQTIEGRIQADNSALAMGRLRAQGLQVERIRSVLAHHPEPELPRGKGFAARVAEEAVYPIVSGIPVKDLAVFYRQFATLIGAGLPLYQALSSLERQTGNGRLKAILRECQEQVMGGGRLSDVFAAHRWAFSELQVEMLRAAEVGGTLEGTLERLSTYLEQELALRRTIGRLTLYPKIVLLSALFLLGRSFFTSGMPAVSAVILGTMGKTTYSGVDYLKDTAGVLVVIGGVAFIALAFGRTVLFRSPAAREGWELVKYAIPGIGGISRSFALTRFGRAFSAMYSGGLPLLTSIRVAADAAGSCTLRHASVRALEAVNRGESLTSAFRHTRAFPPLVLDMLSTGEQTGNLDAMMAKVADHLEGEAETRAYQYSHVFATAIYLLVALLVGFAVVRFYAGYAGSFGG